MEFKFFCPHCGQHISATPDYIGIQSTCPTCSQPFDVPPPDTIQETLDIIHDAPNTQTPNRTVEVFKAIGGFAVWIIVMVGMLFIAGMLIRGGVWLSDKIYPWLVGLSALALAVSIFALLPLAAFRETRGPSGVGFFIVSYVFGTTLWVWTLLLTYVLWGGLALFIGLFMAGVGVVPIALLATAFKGMWSMFGQIILVLVATYGTRTLGIHLAQKADEQYEDTYTPDEPDLPLKLIVSSWLLLPGLFLPYVGYILIIPLIVCPIILCCSKARRARRHGQILLAAFVLLFISATLIGWFFPDWFPART